MTRRLYCIQNLTKTRKDSNTIETRQGDLQNCSSVISNESDPNVKLKASTTHGIRKD